MAKEKDFLDVLASFNSYTQEEIETIRQKRRDKEAELRKAKCPWCDGATWREYHTNGRPMSLWEQEVIERRGRYWHPSCVEKQEKWLTSFRAMLAELAWHIKIDLTCCPKPAYPADYNKFKLM